MAGSYMVTRNLVDPPETRIEEAGRRLDRIERIGPDSAQLDGRTACAVHGDQAKIPKSTGILCVAREPERRQARPPTQEVSRRTGWSVTHDDGAAAPERIFEDRFEDGSSASPDSQPAPEAFSWCTNGLDQNPVALANQSPVDSSPPEENLRISRPAVNRSSRTAANAGLRGASGGNRGNYWNCSPVTPHVRTR